jgi:YcxB-like protein
VQISYELTIDDYRQAFKAHRKRTAFSRWGWRIAYACFVLVLFTALLLLFFGEDKSFRNLFPLWALLAFWICVIWYSPYRAAQKMIKGSPATTLPRTVEITDAGIHSQSSAAESRLAWESIVDWVEVERVFTLFLTPISFFPIPKRAMSEGQQGELRGLLQTRVVK